uniref:Predicted protein n=1 Tax=Physcomitrium patens TaxID=3218 RepID=A9TUY2_PHYPA
MPRAELEQKKERTRKTLTIEERGHRVTTGGQQLEPKRTAPAPQTSNRNARRGRKTTTQHQPSYTVLPLGTATRFVKTANQGVPERSFAEVVLQKCLRHHRNKKPSTTHPSRSRHPDFRAFAASEKSEKKGNNEAGIHFVGSRQPLPEDQGSHPYSGNFGKILSVQ